MTTILLFLLLLLLHLVNTEVAHGACGGSHHSSHTVSGGFEYTYPWPIHYQLLKSQNQTLCQAYMIVDPDPSIPQTYTGSRRTVVLLHGKNFCGATWETTACTLLSQGYRVVIPDQVGFCKSSKPRAYQFSLQQLALNTQTILDSLGITSIYLVSHSLGGMLAIRFSLMFPSAVAGLILVDPIGLEDWKAKGVPYLAVDELYRQERVTNYSSLRAYQQQTYYAGTWEPAYDVWVNMLLRVYGGSHADSFAFDQALITDMVLTQPVVYELPLLKNLQTLLIIGKQDTTAIGKAWSPPEVQAMLGHYDVLGQETAKALGPNCTYVLFPELGHAPQIQAPERFHNEVLGWLTRH